MEVALRSKTQTWEFQIEPLRTPHEGLLSLCGNRQGRNRVHPLEYHRACAAAFVNQLMMSGPATEGLIWA